MKGAVKPCVLFEHCARYFFMRLPLTLRPRAKRSYIIVSVGGSLIVPDGIDTSFLTEFRATILDLVARGFSFYIIAGGGKVARDYQHAAEKVRGDLSAEDVDWMGIHATRMNAHLLRVLFKEEAQDRIVKNPTRKAQPSASIVIGAGWKPGWSTDYCAVLAARRLGARKMINLSNIDYVYDKNPKEFPDAQKIESINWKKFRTLIPDHWDPGLSSPFDPIAAKEAEVLGMEVAIINGRHIAEFKKYITGDDFIGTTIS
jgi:uridylate kinase